MHFHWGFDSGTGSEHLIQSQRYITFYTLIFISYNINCVYIVILLSCILSTTMRIMVHWKRLSTIEMVWPCWLYFLRKRKRIMLILNRLLTALTKLVWKAWKLTCLNKFKWWTFCPTLKAFSATLVHWYCSFFGCSIKKTQFK